MLQHKPSQLIYLSCKYQPTQAHISLYNCRRQTTTCYDQHVMRRLLTRSWGGAGMDPFRTSCCIAQTSMLFYTTKVHVFAHMSKCILYKPV